MPRAASGIDCDIHPALPSISTLFPYLPAYWSEQLRVRGTDGFDSILYPPNAGFSCRADWRDGARPGTSLEALRRHALDEFGTRIAVCNLLYNVAAVRNADLGTVLARAMNDWLAAEWLDREPRLRAAIHIAPQDPLAAAEEIERRAADPRFVHVLLPAMDETLLGKRQFRPIHEAAARHRLPLAIHAQMTATHATTSNGWPSHLAEDHIAMAHAFQAQLLSFVYEGAFTAVPGLRLVLLESGFAWLPSFLWRADRTWKAMRAEVPWVNTPPSAILREHVRIALQPAEAPPDPAQLPILLEQLGGDELLLFSTDWPHAQFAGNDPFPAGFPASLRRRVAEDNPRAVYPRIEVSP